MTDTRLRPFAFHEAGHAVVGASFDRPIRYVSIEAGEDFLGVCVYDDYMRSADPEFYLLPETRERLWRETVSGEAGWVSEEMFSGSYNQTYAGRDRQSTRMLAFRALATAEELQKFLDASIPDTEKKAIYNAHYFRMEEYRERASDQARILLNKHCDAVIELAERLLRDGTVDGVIVSEVVRRCGPA